MDKWLALAVILFPVALSVVGAIMGVTLIKPRDLKTKRKKTIWIVVILFIGVVGSVVTYYQQEKARQASDDKTNLLQTSINSLQSQYNIDMAYMKGQQDAMITHYFPEQFRGVTDVIRKTIPEIKQQAIKEYSSKPLTNNELSQKAIAMAKKMRVMEVKHRQEFDAVIQKWKLFPNPSTEQQRILSAEQNSDTNRIIEAHDLEFRNNLLGEAAYLKDELEKRVPVDAQQDVIRRSGFPLTKVAFWGRLAGASPLSDAAYYLEGLAVKLSPELSGS